MISVDYCGTSLTAKANFEEEMRLSVLVPCSIYVIFLPNSLHHLAGKPARDFTPMKSVVRAVAVGCRGQLEPPLSRLIICEAR